MPSERIANYSDNRHICILNIEISDMAYRQLPQLCLLLLDQVLVPLGYLVLEVQLALHGFLHCLGLLHLEVLLH